jgi:hypothetical protein
MSETKSKVNPVYKFAHDMFTYELVMGGTAFFATAAVVVLGLTPVTLVVAVVAPVVAGVASYHYGL